MRKSQLAAAVGVALTLGSMGHDAFARSASSLCMAEGEVLLDVDDVLGAKIDDVEEAPEFVNPPDGDYKLAIKDAKIEKYKTTDKETKAEVEKTRLKIFYSVAETIELANAEEEPVSNGSLFTEQFMTNAQGLSYFKRQAKNILGEDNIKGCTIGQILEALSEGTALVTANVRLKVSTSKQPGEDGKKKVFTNVQVRIKAGSNLDTQLASE